MLLTASLCQSVACNAQEPALDDTDIITGAGAHFAWVVFDALKADLQRVTGNQVVLHGKHSALGMGCNAGIKLAMENTTEKETFGFVCCPLSAEEVQQKGLVVYPIAKEPIMILVNSQNPVTDISSEQARAIFRGEITNWNEVGGLDQPIVVVTRLHCKKRPGHWKTILPDQDNFRDTRINVSSAAEMVERVSSFKGAIGHVGSTWDFDEKSHVRALSIDGYKPTADNLKSHNYPFFRNLSAITNKHPSSDLLKLINEVRDGSTMRMVAKEYQLLPLAPEE